MEKKNRKVSNEMTGRVPRTKVIMRLAQAAERRALRNRRHDLSVSRDLCKRLKEYYAATLTWMGVTPGGISYTDTGGRLHRGWPRLRPYLVDLLHDNYYGMPFSRYFGTENEAWSLMMRMYVFAVFEDGYKVGLRLDAPLLLLDADEPAYMVMCPPDGCLDGVATDVHECGTYHIFRLHPTIKCFVGDDEL